MKYEISSLNTKKALADALKTCMQTKPLSKITVSEIVRMCEVNRKTFYYHFVDIYDLLKWMLEEEAINVVKQFNLMIDYQDAIRFVIDYVHQNQYILSCAYDSMGRDEMKRFFYKDVIGITENYIKSIEKELNVKLTDEYMEFLIHFFTESIAGLLIDEFKEQQCHNPEKALEYLSTVLKYSVPEAIKNGPQK